MSWIVLVIAGLLEVVWAIGLKYTWFYPPDAQRHHYRRNDCQYRHVVMGDAKLASRNGLRCLDGNWRGRGCHYRYSAAGGVCEPGAHRQPRVNRRGYHRVKTQYPLMRLFYPE